MPPTTAQSRRHHGLPERGGLTGGRRVDQGGTLPHTSRSVPPTISNPINCSAPSDSSPSTSPHTASITPIVSTRTRSAPHPHLSPAPTILGPNHITQHVPGHSAGGPRHKVPAQQVQITRNLPAQGRAPRPQTAPVKTTLSTNPGRQKGGAEGEKTPHQRALAHITVQRH